MALWILSGSTQLSLYEKGKSNRDFTEARVAVASAGLYADHPRQITTPVPHHNYNNLN